MHILSEIEKICDEFNDSCVYLFSDLTEHKGSLGKVDYQRSVVNQFLSNHFKIKVEVRHNDKGAPFLYAKLKRNISISHSGNRYAVQLSEKRDVAIDIQLIERDLIGGKDFFVNDRESDSFEMNTDNLYIIWSVKESMYKLLKGKVKSAKEEFVVREMHSNLVRIDYLENSYDFFLRIEKEYVLVYYQESPF